MRSTYVKSCRSEARDYSVSILHDQLRFPEHTYLSNLFKSDLFIVEVQKQIIGVSPNTLCRVVICSRDEFTGLFQEDISIVCTKTVQAVSVTVKERGAHPNIEAILLITYHHYNQTETQQCFKI